MTSRIENLPTILQHFRYMVIHLYVAGHFLKVICVQHLLVGESLYLDFYSLPQYSELSVPTRRMRFGDIYLVHSEG